MLKVMLNIKVLQFGSKIEACEFCAKQFFVNI